MKDYFDQVAGSARPGKERSPWAVAPLVDVRKWAAGSANYRRSDLYPHRQVAAGRYGYPMPAFSPQSWDPPLAPRLAGAYEENALLSRAELWPTPAVGPEDVLVTDEGEVITGLEDGSIVRFPAKGGLPRTMASTGGRPLGIEILEPGAFVVCDAHRGVLRVTENGEVSVLADSWDGERFLLTNNATVSADGLIYFTVSSRRWTIDNYVTDLLEHTGTGMLFALRPDSTLEPIAVDSPLHFPNGVALDGDESSLFITETGAYRIRRFWLKGVRAGTWEVFADNLPGFPDNATFNDGLLWVGLPSPRQRIIDWMAPRPWTRRIARRLPAAMKPSAVRHGMVLAFDPDGTVIHNLQDSSGKVAVTTGARWHDGKLYIGMVEDPMVAVYTP